MCHYGWEGARTFLGSLLLQVGVKEEEQKIME